MPTTNLGLTYLVSAQSQPEVTINSNLDTLDAIVFRKTGDTISRTAVTSGTPTPLLRITAPADTGLTASAEVLDVDWNFTATKTWATGALTNERHVLIQGGTFAAAGASTITNAATVHILGAPTAGTNVTITNNAALWVQGPVVFGTNVVGTSKAGFTFAQGQTSGQPTAIFVQPAASSTLTASTEANIINLALNRTVTWAAGALTTQREVLIQAPTYAFASASTITDAATLAISGAPVAGSNATITNNYALWVQAGGARIQGHLNFGGGTAPTAAAGSNAGTSPPAPVVTSGAADSRANMTFGTGTTPAAGNMVAVTFGAAFGAAPLVLVSANNAATEALNLYATSITTTGFTLGAGNAPAASQANTTYSFTFFCVQ